jgi:hypothetical protein
MLRHWFDVLSFFAITLGPTKLTVNDMWRMVWEQHSYSIVMVTSLFELNRVSNNIVIAIIVSVISCPRRHHHCHHHRRGHSRRRFMWYG